VFLPTNLDCLWGGGHASCFTGQDEGNRVERGKRGETDRWIWGARKNSKGKKLRI